MVGAVLSFFCAFELAFYSKGALGESWLFGLFKVFRIQAMGVERTGANDVRERHVIGRNVCHPGSDKVAQTAV